MNINLAKLFLITAVTLSGCITSPEGKIAGTYAMDPGGVIIMVLREREGIHVVESFTLGEFDGGQNTYKVVGKEVHVQEQGKPSVVVFRIEPKGDLTPFAMIEKGRREEIPKKLQITWKKAGGVPEP